jgi:hypothetical protein
MIFGEYPCCDEPLSLTIPLGARLPLYTKDQCPKCGTTCWHKLSRFDPTSWTEEDFLAEHDVDAATNTVTRKT